MTGGVCIKIKETDLYEPVKKWLENRGMEVFNEVAPHCVSNRADVVGMNEDVTVVVEMKTSLSLDLLDQATFWSDRRLANYVYIAIPTKSNKNYKSIKHRIAENILRSYGIGVLFVDFTRRAKFSGGHIDDKPFMRAKYKRVNPKSMSFRDFIEKYKMDFVKSDTVGGQKAGGHVTQYRSTINKVQELLREVKYGDSKSFVSLWWHENGKMIDLSDISNDGWIDMSTILNYCDTHYASPKPSLSKALREFENDWCEVKNENRKLYFRYREEGENVGS